MAKTITAGFINEKINGISVNTSLKCHSSNYTADDTRVVIYPVIHYTGNTKDVAVNNAKYFQGANRKASAQLIVDNDNIYQIMRLSDIAWHCGTLGAYFHPNCSNSNSIGIEMCCTAGNYKVSKKTKTNTAHLVAYLCELLNIKPKEVDTYLLRHYDVTHKNCPAQMAGKSNVEWVLFRRKVKKLLKKRLKKEYTARASTRIRVFKKANAKSKVVEWRDKGAICKIVKEKNGFGKLKSGKGWVKLKYIRKESK